MSIFSIKRFKLMIIVFLLSLSICGLAIANQARVAIAPFTINAEKDLTYLKNGITDMLGTRLSSTGEADVITREETKAALSTITGELNEEKARELGVGLKADYILYGSLTVFGESVSIDAKMVDAHGLKKTLSFYNQAGSMNDVISTINKIATEINEKVFGKKAIVRATPVKIEKSVEKTPEPDIHAHPEKLLEEGFKETPKPAKATKAPNPAFITESKTTDSKEATDAGSVPNPAFIKTHGKKTTNEFWKSRNFNILINGMAIGDVDGDGKVETIIITPHTVHIYRVEENRFKKIKEIKESRYNNFIGVDVADINGNNVEEIFITSLTAQKNSVNSIVFEFKDGNFKKIVKSSPWYYRVARLPGRGSVLLGQRHKSGSPYSKKIYTMAWENSEYVSQDQIGATRKNNLMGLTIGDAMNEDRAITIAYDDADYLMLLGDSGDDIWTGGKKYGGSTLYFSMPKTDQGQTENRKFLPMRIIVDDPDKDGANEVIVAKNYDIAFSKMDKFRKFTETHIESLYWDGIGLATNWKTRKISGHIRDFAIGDFDNDGGKELVAALVIKEGSVVAMKPKCTVIAYDLGK